MNRPTITAVNFITFFIAYPMMKPTKKPPPTVPANGAKSVAIACYPFMKCCRSECSSRKVIVNSIIYRTYEAISLLVLLPCFFLYPLISPFNKVCARDLMNLVQSLNYILYLFAARIFVEKLFYIFNQCVEDMN